ncbi:hypothetical protein COCC4DRAFT_34902 [Bipolaris maydis ATCC 48331]|uniref:Uncharacterized protein n=2 Tax=Cochliobolus heterostrophus TaxID=5016 RepID=M2U595_COCH5|nr:uncharacterized protein COCC4DRAFT_34902 [Bipolaris maydis ATCC 48331]EMD93719.1 hypothetical protein COCHEDRAFT_1020623 [Bipolaris maydis C5]ENH99293.1 hypothetical protein COCC4DRAFT_34902 [Bipolaris maydis ATCC 48331]KAJ6204952.1 hypothetical protein PSV09DRAFT_1020623 [Bipolaris maydis]
MDVALFAGPGSARVFRVVESIAFVLQASLVMILWSLIGYSFMGRAMEIKRDLLGGRF